MGNNYCHFCGKDIAPEAECLVLQAHLVAIPDAQFHRDCFVQMLCLPSMATRRLLGLWP